MSVTPSYPGVYIEEPPSPVRTIIGGATSVTAFVGRAMRGPVNDPRRVQSFAEFERVFGGLWVPSTLSYAVWHYFQNGGSDAVIVRIVHPDATAATLTLPGSGGAGSDWTLTAASQGAWGGQLQAHVDYDTRDKTDNSLFNLFVKDPASGLVEGFRNVSVDSGDSRFVERILAEQSTLVRVSALPPAPITRPKDNASPSPGGDLFGKPTYYTGAAGGSDGAGVVATDYEGDPLAKTGVYALDRGEFNILCMPPPTGAVRAPDPSWGDALGKALTYCHSRRAFFIMDPPLDPTHDINDVQTDVIANIQAVTDSFSTDDKPYGAVYFPFLRMADPKQENVIQEFVPCGAVAGVFARTDGERGLWKAPAGQEAGLAGVQALSYKLTDGENGQLNPVGINCLRSFAGVGSVVWGARTLLGADKLASQWKYVPIRRLASYIERSLYDGTQWVVFEPNDEPLWAQIRLNVGAFMNNLYRQGAFQGQTPSDAYFVRCDKETTTQDDRDRGIVNILVGFAPLKPAEFVIIKISQIAGQVQT